MAQSEHCLSRGFLLSATALLASTAIFAGSALAGSLAIGPVEQINLRSSTIVVLGQTYHLSPSAHILDRASSYAVALGSIAPGTLVVVDGAESAAGKTSVQDVILLPQLDVPGATQLLVTGVISAGSNVGQIRVGSLRVDVNATLTSDAQGPAVGQLVQIVGTQPTPQGLFLAQHVAAITGVAVSARGIAGTGDASRGIAGTGATSLGIAGTGTASRGIAGTGTTSLGIAGTGTASFGIAGTGDKGIAGTGTASRGIAGTGATSLGIAGTGDKGIAGTGTASRGIAGTGK